MSVSHIRQRCFGSQQHFFKASLCAVNLIECCIIGMCTQLAHIYLLAVLRYCLLYYHRRHLPAFYHNSVYQTRIYRIIRHNDFNFFTLRFTDK